MGNSHHPIKIDAITKPSRGAVAVGAFVAPLASKAISAKGTILTALIADWPAIAGPNLATFTKPMKLSRGAAGDPGDLPRAAPSHLVVSVDPARALDMQYMTPQLIERINQTLGYKAVASIRLLQSPVKRAKPAAAATRVAVTSASQKSTSEKPLSKLEAALARMAAGVQTRKS